MNMTRSTAHSRQMTIRAMIAAVTKPNKTTSQGCSDPFASEQTCSFINSQQVVNRCAFPARPHVASRRKYNQYHSAHKTCVRYFVSFVYQLAWLYQWQFLHQWWCQDFKISKFSRYDVRTLFLQLYRRYETAWASIPNKCSLISSRGMTELRHGCIMSPRRTRMPPTWYSKNKKSTHCEYVVEETPYHYDQLAMNTNE